MTDKELIKKWLKVKLAELYEESQCEVPEISQEIIKGKMIAIKESLSFIDSMQEELKKCMYTNEHYTDEDRKVLCEDCEERCEYSKKEEPVSDDLEEAARCFRDELHLKEGKRDNYGNPYFTQDSILKTFKAGANWQKTKDSTCVSNDLEEAAKEWLIPKLDKSYEPYGERKMMELTLFDGYAMLEAIEFGAQWQRSIDDISKRNIHKNAIEYGKREMIKKASEYLQDNTLFSKLIIEDFRKAMED